MLADRGMNTLGQGNEIRVHGASNDSRVHWIFLMQPNEMPPVVSQQRSTITFRKHKDFVIRP